MLDDSQKQPHTGFVFAPDIKYTLQVYLTPNLI